MDPHIITQTKQVRRGEADGIWHLQADICVVGAGIAGISAALEAARLGRKVVLADSMPQLGGQTYNALIGCFCGFYSNGQNGYQFTHGVADDLFTYMEEAGGLYENPSAHTLVPHYNETIFLRWAEKRIEEAGITLLLGSNLEAVQREGRRLTQLRFVTRYGIVSVAATGAVDASGDAAVAWLAGLPCHVPEEGMVYGSEMFLLENIDYSTPPPTEAELMERMAEKGDDYGLVRKKGLMFYTPARGGIAFGNMTHIKTPLDPLEASLITITGKDQVDTVVAFLQSEYPQNFAHANVRAYGVNGIRQTRWIEGMKQLSLADVRAGTKFPDAIARSAWPVELHSHGDGYVWEVFDEDHVHYIPLGSLLSPEADNYAACGRCIDADVAALSSVRVMGPCTATGAAAAHALVLAGKGSVHEIDLAALQAELYDNIERRD